MPYKNKEDKKRNAKEWYEKNRERLLAEKKKYHQEHKELKNAYTKKWRENHKEYTREYDRLRSTTEVRKEQKRNGSRTYYARKREFIDTLKSSLACDRCGFSDVRALQFHHVNPPEKKFSIANWPSKNISYGDLLAEIKKCIVLCANCHAIFHSKKKIKE